MEESELWAKSALRPIPQQPSAGREDEEEEEEEEEVEEEEEGSGQRGRWHWPLSELEAVSPSLPPPPPPPLLSRPASGVAKEQRGCLHGVHLCESEHFRLHTCIHGHTKTHISQVETPFLQASRKLNK